MKKDTDMQEKYDNDFYEEAGDLLSPFRRKYGGAIIGKNGADPFAKDPDSIQGEHDDTLRQKQLNNLNL